ncbi:MAG TPA: DUF4162 domain-containing protein, partial [Candidatus Thermoplasmatota archaeon]|nr:DUF4162 domain-containing protein [Candidatus Thermoplasmatota archaeon]
PTTGLDPRSRNQVWELVRRIAGQGTTVLLTTQYLEEADRLAGRLAVVDHGRVIAEGTSRDLKSSVGANALHVRLASAADAPLAHGAAQAVLGRPVPPAADASALSLTVAGASEASEVLAELARRRVEVLEFALGAPTLDDVFFALTGRAAGAAPGAAGGEAKAGGPQAAGPPGNGAPAAPARTEAGLATRQASAGAERGDGFPAHKASMPARRGGKA